MADNRIVDVYLDMMAKDDDGTYWLYNAKHPEKLYEVVSLLDLDGDETDDADIAVGGVVKLGEESFMCFEI